MGGQTGWQHPVPWRSMRLWLRGPREAGCAFPFFCSPSQPQERRLRGLTWPGNTFKLHIPTSAHPELTYSQTLQITSASLRFPGQKQLICGSQSCFVAAGLTCTTVSVTCWSHLNFPFCPWGCGIGNPFQFLSLLHLLSVFNPI